MDKKKSSTECGKKGTRRRRQGGDDDENAGQRRLQLNRPSKSNRYHDNRGAARVSTRTSNDTEDSHASATQSTQTYSDTVASATPSTSKYTTRSTGDSTEKAYTLTPTKLFSDSESPNNRNLNPSATHALAENLELAAAAFVPLVDEDEENITPIMVSSKVVSDYEREREQDSSRALERRMEELFEAQEATGRAPVGRSFEAEQTPSLNLGAEEMMFRHSQTVRSAPGEIHKIGQDGCHPSSSSSSSTHTKTTSSGASSRGPRRGATSNNVNSQMTPMSFGSGTMYRPDDARIVTPIETPTLSVYSDSEQAFSITSSSDTKDSSESIYSESNTSRFELKQIMKEKLDFIEVTNVGKITREKREDLSHIMTAKISQDSSKWSDLDNFFMSSNYAKLKYLHNTADVDHQSIPMCMNSCMLFYGQEHEHLRLCIYCGLRRPSGTSKIKNKFASYYPMRPRLEEMLKNPKSREALKYRHMFTVKRDSNRPAPGQKIYEDFFDGSLYEEMREYGAFRLKYDFALAMPHDSFVFYASKREGMTGIVVINLNLPPSVRVQMKNIMLVMLIPGPKKPKDFNSFLEPFIDEMVVLEDIEKPLSIPRGQIRTEMGAATDLEIGGSGDLEYNAFVCFACADGEAAPVPISFFKSSNAQVPCRFCYIVGWPDIKRPRKKKANHLAHVENLDEQNRNTGATSVGQYYYPLVKPGDYTTEFLEKVLRAYETKLNCIRHVVETEALFEASDSRAFDLHLPELMERTHANDLRLRDVDDTRAAIKLVQNSDNLLKTQKEITTAKKVLGIHGESAVSRLFVPQNCHISKFTTIDLMHVLKNYGELMVNIWKLLPDTDGRPYIEEGMWKEITYSFANNFTSPSGWGRIPMLVFTKPDSLKCIEWVHWILHYSPVVLMKAFRRRVHYDGWMSFVRLIRIALGRRITEKEVTEDARDLVTVHTEYFAEHIYRGLLGRLNLNRYNSHNIVHIPLMIEIDANQWGTWNFTLERFFGVLTPHIKSTSLPYSSVVINYQIIISLNQARMKFDLQSLNETKRYRTAYNLQGKMFIGNKNPFLNSRGKPVGIRGSPLYLAAEEITREHPGYLMYPRHKISNFDMYRDFGLKMAPFARLLAGFIIERILTPTHGEDRSQWPEEEREEMRKMETATNATAREMFAKLIVYGKYRTPISTLPREVRLSSRDEMVEGYILKHQFHTCGSIVQLKKENAIERSMDTNVNINASLVAIRLETDDGTESHYYAQVQFFFSLRKTGKNHLLALVRWTDDLQVPASERGVPYYKFNEVADLKTMYRVAKRNFAIVSAGWIVRPVALWFDRSAKRVYVIDKEKNIPGLDLSLNCTLDRDLA